MNKTFCLIFFGLLLGVLVGCSQPPVRHACPPESLIVDETVFPEGTIADMPMSPLPDGGGTSIANSYGNGDIDVTHAVYPYKKPKGAENAFEEERNRSTQQEMTPYDLSGLPLHAEQSTYLCSPIPSPIPIERTFRCAYIAQYDNYLILLFLRTSFDTPVDVLFPVIQDIDRRMMKCFEEHPATS